MKDEGVIKFDIHWEKKPLDVVVPKDLMTWRDKMYELGLIGEYPDIKIGYGNISVKILKGMLISGTQTGNLERLEQCHYSIVTEYSIQANALRCEGEVKASAESLTHLAFYEADSSIRAIIHIHNDELWKRLMDDVPTSRPDVPYGTPEMAFEIKRLFEESSINKERIMVMGGHEEGLIAFGSNLEEAGEVILRHFQK